MKKTKTTVQSLANQANLAGWFMVLLILGSTLLLAACAGTSSPVPENTIAATDPIPTGLPTASPTVGLTSTPAFPGTVTLWLDWNPEELRVLEQIIENYRLMNPGAEFRVIYLPMDDMRSALDAEIDQAEAPSLVIGPSDWADPLAEAGILRDVAQVIPPEQKEAIHPFALAQVERGSALLGLPLELQGTVLYRNRSLIDEPANTVDRIVEQSQEAILEGGLGSSFDFGYRTAAPFVQTCLGSIDSNPEVIPISQPAGLCWLRLLDRLASSGPVTFDTDEDLERFRNGETLWLLDSSSQMAALERALGEENLTIDNWPLYESTGEALHGAVWTENAYFPSQASDQDFEAAWSFATFLLAPENQQLLSQSRGIRHLPVLPSLELEDTILQQAQRAVNSGIPLVNLSQDEQIRRELSTAIRLVVADAGDPELALGLALEEIRRARIPTPTPTRTPSPTLSPTPTETPPPTPPPG